MTPHHFSALVPITRVWCFVLVIVIVIDKEHDTRCLEQPIPLANGLLVLTHGPVFDYDYEHEHEHEARFRPGDFLRT